jgi:molecular chaperone DnaK
LQKLKDAHKSQDIPQIDAAMAEMNTAWTAASEEIYKASQQGETANAQPQPGEDEQPQTENATGDNVTDAEFEEVK